MTIEVIGGYFAVWNEDPQEDRGYGSIAPNAMHLSTVRNITMRYGTHDGKIFAQTKLRTLRFFNDAYGCAFTADINLDHPGAVALVNAIGAGEVWGASWGAESFEDLALGVAGRIQYCRFDHFALTSCPNYAGTGVWRLSQPWNTLQPWLRDLRRTFNDSVIANARRKHLEPTAFDRQPRKAARASVPASVIRLIDSAQFGLASSELKRAAALHFKAKSQERRVADPEAARRGQQQTRPNAGVSAVR